ncbi:MAG: alpha/beta fold hydrolase, partial [Nocardioidaceae bacterium]
MTFEVEHVTIHGHRRAYVRAGSGPVLLMLHGLGCDHSTWQPVLGALARRYTVIVVGHSFGGGVAMQFAYQFPERTERMILVAPGGLGSEVAPAIRAITLPGFHQAIGLATLPGVRQLATRGLKAAAATG